MEGSSNVLSEAIASSVPVIAAKIPGLVGTLGEKYPGYFQVGNTEELAGLLRRVEADSQFYSRLKSACVRLSPLVDSKREQDALKRLLSEVFKKS